jgi:hypothetical protein
MIVGLSHEPARELHRDDSLFSRATKTGSARPRFKRQTGPSRAAARRARAFFFLALIFNTSDGNFSLESPSGSAPVTGSSEASDPTGCDGAREVGAETGVCHLFPRRRGRLPCTSLAPGTTAGDTYQHGWPHQSAVPPLMVHRSRRNPIPIPTQTVDEPGASRQQ